MAGSISDTEYNGEQNRHSLCSSGSVSLVGKTDINQAISQINMQLGAEMDFINMIEILDAMIVYNKCVSTVFF